VRLDGTALVEMADPLGIDLKPGGIGADLNVVLEQSGFNSLL